MLLFTSIQVAYLAAYSPFEETLNLRLDLFNEMTGLLLVDTLPMFSAYNHEGASLLESDIWFLIILFGNLVVHLYFLMRSTYLSQSLALRKRKYKKVMKQRKEARERQEKAAKKYPAEAPSVPKPETGAKNRLSIIQEEDEPRS
mmetsp:Transcript_943/g.1460  ORF Transcript_943/g.1460 Transcript_943/m.1460 type:complete len:144 (-) Transcript_943:582-1013(-)